MKKSPPPKQKPNSPACFALAMMCLVSAMVWLPLHSDGQIVLSGLLQDGTGQNGDTAGSPLWNTLGNELSYANLYVTQPNAGYTAPFINSGNGANTSISYTLTPGTYQFYFFSDPFANNNPGHYGLSLFFNGNNNGSPGIAAFSASGVSSANAVAAGLNTLPLSANTNFPNPAPGTFISNSTPVLAPGTLTYIADGLSVTLTAYGFGGPGVFGGPALDRVGNLDSQPNGFSDGVGTFSLTVTPVPEPSTVTMSCVAGFIICVAMILKRRVNHRPPSVALPFQKIGRSPGMSP